MPGPNHRTRRQLRLSLALTLSLSMVALPAPSSNRATEASGVGHDSAASGTTPATNDDDAAKSRAREAYGKVGMSFEANRGQTDEQVKFLTRGAGYKLFLTSEEAVFVLRNSDCGLRNQDPPSRSLKSSTAHSETNPQSAICNPQSAVLRLKLEGAKSEPAVSGLEELEGKVNYFIGSDPEKWHTDIPTFARVHYASVYEGVDMVYYGNQQQLEYDFVVRPGADHEQIALSFEGADRIELDAASGDLLLKVGASALRQKKPVVYQDVNGERKQIESSYVVKSANRIGFAVGAYDASRPLIIDPVLAYSTYLGGNDSDSGNGITVDSAGNAYVTGVTSSTDFPTTSGTLDTTDNPGDDAFVTRLNPAGTAIVYSTYLGGNAFDFSSAVRVDSGGNAFVTGETSSPDFPTTPGAFDTTDNPGDDAFVTKLNAAGTALVYSTLFGGNDFDYARRIALDSSGNAYVTGETLSTDLPTTPGAFDTTDNPEDDAFVIKLNASGTALIYSTYLGGNGYDSCRDIAADSAGNAYVTGRTGSTDFSTTPGAFDTTDNPEDDAFVTKLNTSGTTLIYSTYLGGNSFDSGNGIAVDSVGNVYATGQADSTDFPTTPDAFDTTADPLGEAFVTKLNASGTALVYSTYLGGNGFDSGYGIAVDSAGNAYLTGSAFSTTFPTTPGAFDTTSSPVGDAFVTKLNASGTALVYSTFLGGNDWEFGGGIAVDSAGNAYVTGLTTSSDFPTTTDAIQSGGGTDRNVFVAKIGDYAISGRVIDSSGNGITGVTITLSGSNSAITTTDVAGYLGFLNTTLGGSYTVTPFKAGLTFTPETITIGNLNGNQELIFVGTITSPTPTPTATPTPTPTPATVQYSAASFSVNEGAGEFQIIVTRSGDTSAAVHVDYATTDGTGSERSDYTTAVGRLRFAAGDTAESFNIFITDDAFGEGNETINITLSNPSSGAQIGGSSNAVLSIVDNDLVNGLANPIDSTEFFVRQHYVDFLNREPDPAGLTFWTNNIDSCGANADCRGEKRTDTSAAFFLSIEFQQTGFLVERVYQSAFNRFPRFREFIPDTQEIGRDVVVGQGSWQAQLDANKLQFATDFAARPDFIAVYGGLTNQQYVDALNANTGGSVSVSERSALVAGLNGATETRASVLRKVAENAAFAQREFNRAFVLMQYFGYLRRNPNDAPDSDFSGYDFWLAKLNSFGGDFRKAEMVKAFITASEYRGRFGDEAVARGRAAFNERNFSQLGANGRSCADCHMPSESFQLSPAAAQSRLAALQAARIQNPNADDPLFRPVDADDFRLNGNSASDFSNLVENGLVRVTMPLPLNVKLVNPITGQPTDETSVDLWRAVTPVLNVAITGPDGVLPIWAPGAPRPPIMGQDPNGPNRQGGYQHDARFGTLQEQARGALFAHAQVSVEPPARLLDDLTAFQETLFSSFGVERLAHAIRSGSTTFPDPDPALNEVEQQGKVVFNRACAQCHGGTLHPSGSTGETTIVRPIARYHNIGSPCPRSAGDNFLPCPERLGRNARTYRITLATGATQTFTTSDPGRLLLTGQIGDLGVMDVTQVRGISRTAPYFHNNSAATLEEVLDHYDALFRRAARLNPPPNLPPFLSSNGLVVDRGFVLANERAALLAYLRKL